ncbi:c6 zinc finger [Fusarium subglutinans]|uniref:C6 zinc finger n=1 Tax=Gibberella subglutinans TaxID=42677 RepID=A0A8H5Q986_GIBSU|nr:c6 zinc finger [Fusarium subglutinans]KAF5610559.1 c6 zinc finger [Fusarium subglutinans]
MSARNSFHQITSNSNREDTYSGNDELSSNSNSPSSGVDGRASPCGSTSTTAESSRMSVTSVPAACLACRGRHLKCDGVNPCSRCLSSGSECVYVASRRGYKGPRRNTVQKTSKKHGVSPARTRTRSGESSVTSRPERSASLGSSVFLSPNMGDDMFHSPLSTPFLDPALDASNSMENDMSFFGPYDTADTSTDMLNLFTSPQHEHVVTHVPALTLPERCIDSFYNHFHAAHPFVLPKESLMMISHESSVIPVLAVMRWIGSLHIPACSERGRFFQEAHQLIYEPRRRKDGFLVQALLLLLIGLDGQGQQEQARQILSGLERISVDIGLNTRSYATTYGRGIPVMEESWRRTWWELFIVDGLVAGVHRSTNFLLFDVASDVALPCEEYEYLSGDVPEPMYLRDMNESDFSGTSQGFSSFAYRIQAAQNLGRLLRIPPVSGPDDESLRNIQTMLTSWRVSLPKSKADALRQYGHFDEMLFQAHMITHATSILLHQPYSQLNSILSQSNSQTDQYDSVSSVGDFNNHTKNIIQAATEISKLVAHRVSLLSHSHFFSYVVTMSSIIHLHRWAIFTPDAENNLRQVLRLNIGALSRMSLVWSASERESSSVKSMARSIYQVKKQHRVLPQFWISMTHDEAMDKIAADDAMIHEFEDMQVVPGMMGHWTDPVNKQWD